MEAALLASLRAAVPAARVDPEPATHTHDWWSRLIMRRRAGEQLPRPAAVVAPADRDEVAALVRWCAEHRIGLVPYGAGTGVCGGAAAVTGAITVDLKRLNDIGPLDEVSGVVRCGPGVILQALEDHLAHRGWTLGHHPSSAHCSTVGGFAAIRSAGQASTFYGTFDQMVIGLRAVLPDGEELHVREVPHASAGPDLKHLLLGGEGTTGIITEVTLRVWPAPEAVVDRGWLFPDLPAGLDALRAVMRTGLRPAVLRLYDETDTALVFGGQGLEVPQGCLLIVGVEGSREVAPLVAEVTSRVLRDAGGTDLGSEPGRHWREHRHRVSYRYAEYMKPGGTFGDALLLDTFEVCGLWARLPGMYAAVRAALGEHVDLVLAHVSHCYPEGASIYFTMGAMNDGDEELALERYDAAWDAAATAALDAGGSMSHHHGVGLVRAPYLPRELGATGWQLLRDVKRALDPDGLLNPGKLGLGGVP